MWAIYALLSAFFAATADPVAKKALSRGSDEYLVGTFTLLLSTPFLFFAYLSARPAAPLNASLIKTLVAVLPFEVLACILYYKALKTTDISLSVPFLALTPVFTILTAFFLLGERIRPLGIAGILFITIGVYTLNIKEAKYSLLHPVRAIFRNKGSYLMAAVALLFSITTALSKKAMLCSTPMAIPFIYNLSVSSVLAPILFYRVGRGYSAMRKDYGLFALYLALGFLLALACLFYFKAVSMANVPYVISIKRLSLLMSVGYGWLFFKERDIHIRFFSTCCMLVGMALILVCH
jgi:drug/metabolite transporter (DMT)-like permease